MASVQASPTTNASASPGAAGSVTLRRHRSQDSSDLGPTAKDLLTAFERTISDKKSHALLLWPQPVHGISVVHALAALPVSLTAISSASRPSCFRGIETLQRLRKPSFLIVSSLSPTRESLWTEFTCSGRHTPPSGTFWRSLVFRIWMLGSRVIGDTARSSETQASCIPPYLKSCSRPASSPRRAPIRNTS